MTTLDADVRRLEEMSQNDSGNDDVVLDNPDSPAAYDAKQLEQNSRSVAADDDIPTALWIAGILLLVIPLVTVNGVLSEWGRIRASLSPFETFVIYWDKVPTVLLLAGLVNLIYVPVFYCLVTLFTFGAARVLNGKGNLEKHGRAMAAAYLKIVLLALPIFAITAIISLSQCLGLVVLVAIVRLLKNAISGVHEMTPGRAVGAVLIGGVITLLVVVPLQAAMLSIVANVLQ